MSRRITRTTMAALLIVGVVLTSGTAAQDRSQQQPQASQQQDSQQQDSQQQQQRSQQRGQWELDPAGWIRVGYDFDDDNRIDAYEYIFAYDLERARQQSRRRAEQERQQGRRQTAQRQQRRMGQKIQGQVASLEKRNIKGQEGRQLIATIRTDQGQKRKVFLGSAQELSQLDLQQGDNVTVHGSACTLNGQRALKAHQIRAKGQTARLVSPERSRAMEQGRRPRARTAMGRGSSQTSQRFQTTGTVRKTKQMKLSGQQEKHLFAVVDSDRGNRIVVNLGPVDKANPLDLSQGDQIQAVGRRVMVNQKPVLMASQARAGGQTVRIPQTRGSQTRRLKGQIVKTATKRLEGQDKPAHLIALVELETGQRVPVDLGRKQDLQDRDIQVKSGKDIVVLARPFRIGNKRILAAQSISFDGERIDVEWLRRMSRQRGSQRVSRN